MDIKELFKGIVLVIDDEINEKSASINQIVSQLESENLSLLKTDCLPDIKVIASLHNLSFVLLDWQLFDVGEDISRMGLSELQSSNDEQILDFLEELMKVCFCPIFIFTTLPSENIISKLEKRALYNSSKMDMFFIKHKDSVKDKGKVFEELSNWISTNPVIYLLKYWDNAYQFAKENLFIDFQKSSSNWVSVLWNTLKEDGDSDFEIATELFDILQKTIANRITVPQLERTILESQSDCKKDEIIRIIEQTKFIENKKLNDMQANTGDIFFDSQENLYYINIRPQCDLLRCKNPELYCLKGKALNLKLQRDNCYINEDDITDGNKGKNEYIFSQGEFVEKKNNCIISYINSGKIIEFKFKKLIIKKWDDLKTKRIGKLLPPFITNIRQKYATYIEREGIPRLPNGLIGESDDGEK